MLTVHASCRMNNMHKQVNSANNGHGEKKFYSFDGRDDGERSGVSLIEKLIGFATHMLCRQTQE